MNTKPIPFAEFRRFLLGLGYAEKCTATADIVHRAEKHLLVFRRYRDDEEVAPRDLLSTRKFLDLRGLMEAADFDAFLQRATTTA
jgi:hypothetical protein